MSAVSEDSLRIPVDYAGQSYLPISIDSIRIDSVPKFDLYFRAGSNQPFVLYCEHNTTFTASARQKIERNRISQFFVRTEHRSEYNRYLSENLETFLNDRKLTVRKKAVILYDCAQAVVEDVLTRPRSRDVIQRGKDIVRHTVDFMTSKDFMLEHLLRTISCDYYLYTHSVNVVAYTIALAMEVGYHDGATLREIANGALLHDVGKSQLDATLLNKPGPLTPREWEKIQSHPALGHALLREQAQLGEIAFDIVLHHHEKMDGSGYPDHLSGDMISPFTHMVAIADIFDALTTDRFHQKAQNSFEALTLMLNTMSDELDRDLVKAFVTMMGMPKK